MTGRRTSARQPAGGMPRSVKTVGTLLATVLSVRVRWKLGAAPSRGNFGGSSSPTLRGRQVMVFPVQLGSGLPGDASPEIVFALRSRTDAVAWIFPDELEAIKERSPAVDIAVSGLPVGVFLSAEVKRIGDPLYGLLRRLGALTDSDIAVIPVTVRAGAEGVGGTSVVEIVATIVNVRTGRVIWFGVVGGRPGSVADFGTVASAVEALAETLLWWVQ